MCLFRSKVCSHWCSRTNKIPVVLNFLLRHKCEKILATYPKLTTMDQWWNNVSAWSENTAKDAAEGFNSFSHGVEDTAHNAAGGFDTFSQGVEETAHNAAGGFDTFSKGVEETAHHASDEVVSFSQHFPENVNSWINQAAMSIQKAVEAGDSSELGRWLKKASKAIGFDDLLAQLAVVKLENLPNDILNYIRENPGQVAFFVLGAVVLIAPVLVWGPAFAAMGWSAKGIQAGLFPPAGNFISIPADLYEGLSQRAGSR
ncbi:uncharacterized protein MYCGRDRAFT_92726 [Zymoseptoria tritici IPO323]|uniref:Uncharacterized protein n=1 Tax=Zymoseptoria tritici (strain CBS 115943 / IPO323) TaxID=336722 RepID=F9X9Z8_ZYMTI|nr:uncharacterized protein MYCGRDRAFT_92726 [Zymoseptoria tritici IPO323]EGP88299.1 hypothetical protein MYCGRDRAFT_92726 [Zymoseptoria tritici IPO323]